MSSTVVTASDWTKGISLSVLASIIGGASKLAIRKSWLLEQELERIQAEEENPDRTTNHHGAVDDHDEDEGDESNLVVVSAVSTLSQEEGEDDDPVGNEDLLVHDGAREGSVEMTGEMVTVTMMRTPRHDDEERRRRHSNSTIPRRSSTGEVDPATSVASNMMSSSSSTSSLRQRLSLLVSRGGNPNNSAEGDVVDATLLSSPYVRAPSSDPMARRRSRDSTVPAPAAPTRRLSSSGGGAALREQSALSSLAMSSSSSSGRILNNNNRSHHENNATSLEEGDINNSSRSEAGRRRSSSSRSRRNSGVGSIVAMSTTSTRRGCCQSRFWIVSLRGAGMIGMTFLNPLCGVLAMNFASPSILAPFSGLTLVWIILFSGTLIGERPSPTQVMAALMIVLGEVVVALYGDHTNDSGISAEEVRESYQEPLFLVYFVVMALWMALLVYWMRGGSATLRRFAWGVSGGSLTGLQNFLKDALTVTKAAHVPAQRESGYMNFEREQSSHFLLVAMFVIMAVLAAFGGLVLLTACMKRYDVTYSAAMFVGSFVLSASIMSAIHYDTFAHLHSVSSYVMYPTGLVILIGGVYMLVQESKECNDAEFEELVGVESSPVSPPSIVSISSSSGRSHGRGMIALDANLTRNRSTESGRGQGYYA